MNTSAQLQLPGIQAATGNDIGVVSSTRRRALDPLPMPVFYEPSWDGKIHVPHYNGEMHAMDVASPIAAHLHQLAFWMGHLVASIAQISDSFHTTRLDVYSIRDFCKFAAENAPNIRSTADINSATLAGYSRWVREHKNWGHSQQAKKYNRFVSALETLRRFRPALVDPRLYTARFRVRANRLPDVKNPLTLEVAAKIERICITSIDSYYNRWKAAQNLMAEAAADGVDERELHIDQTTDLGAALLKLRYALTTPGWRTTNFYIALCRRAAATFNQPAGSRSKPFPLGPKGIEFSGIAELQGLIYPRRDDIFPFLLMVALRCGANSTSVADLTVNCLSTADETAHGSARVHDALNPSPTETEYVTWIKKRVGKIHSLPFSSTKPYHPPALIRKVLEITAVLRSRTTKDYEGRLFICSGRPKNEKPGSDFLLSNLPVALKAFREAHPELPKFNLGHCRKRYADAAIIAAGGNLAAAKTVLHHKQVGTIMQHYAANEGRQLLEKVLARFLGNFQRFIAEGKVGAPISEPAAVIAPETLPMSQLSGAAHQIAAAFGDAEAIINADDAEVCARIVQFLRHAASQQTPYNVQRWQKTLGPIHEFLTQQVLPRFSARAQHAAEYLVPFLSPLPSFE